MLLQEVIARVRQMESYLEMVLEAIENHPESATEDEEIKDALRELADYYENGQWLRDYEIDERGLLPEDLKRGVLAEDTLYDLLDQVGWGEESKSVNE